MQTVTLNILTLRLPIPVPLKYPAPDAFPMGVSLKQEKPPRLRGLLLCRPRANVKIIGIKPWLGIG